MILLKRHEWKYIKKNTSEPKMLQEKTYKVSKKAVQRYETINLKDLRFAIAPDVCGVDFSQWQSPHSCFQPD